MRHFPLLRTKRLTVQFKELSIGAAIALANVPEHLTESGTTLFLKSIISSIQVGNEDPAQWTIPERTLAISHYLASTLEDGPDFSLGTGKYSDYLDSGIDTGIDRNNVLIGEVGGDKWMVQQLTGAMTESIERLLGSFESLPVRLHWVIGAMAAQLSRFNDTETDLSSDALYDEWLLSRMEILMEFPESDFELLMSEYRGGCEKLHHLFDFSFDDSGIVILPRQGGAEDLPAARFPVRAALSKMALAMAGKSY